MTAAAPFAATEPVALHPERTADPATVRWQVAGPSLAGLGTGTFDPLVAAGALAGAVAGDRYVDTTLAAGRSWPVEAPVVRDAVAAAVSDLRAAAVADPDVALAGAAERVLAEVAPYVAGHGGSITLAGVSGGVVELDLRGACHGCPAATFTVQGRVGRRLAEECAVPAEVRVRDPRR